MTIKQTQQYAQIFLFLYLFLIIVVGILIHPEISTFMSHQDISEYLNTLYSDTTSFHLLMKSFPSIVGTLHFISVYSFICFTYYFSKNCQHRRQKYILVLSIVLSLYYIIGLLASSLILHNTLGMLGNAMIFIITTLLLISVFIYRKRCHVRLFLHLLIPILIYEMVQLLTLYSNPSFFNLLYLCFIGFYYLFEQIFVLNYIMMGLSIAIIGLSFLSWFKGFTHKKRTK